MILDSLSIQAESIPVSITIDDLSIEDVAAYSAEKIDDGIRSVLMQEKIHAMAFVCGKRVDSPEGRALIKKWDDEGHAIANHSYSHLNLNSPKVSVDEYIADLEKNWKIVEGYKNSARIFRFPFLKDGLEAPKCDVMRAYLEKNNVQNGSVTIAASDWLMSDRLKRAILGGRKDVTGYRDFYIEHMLGRLQFYDGLSKELFGQSIPHTLLIHYNVLNGLFLADLLKAYQSKNVKWIHALDAYQDPVFKNADEDVLATGESLLWAIAKQRAPSCPDLRYPDEDGKYLEQEMKKRGL
jgi:hypothetical protein